MIAVMREGVAGAALDTAVSRALLEMVAAGEIGETFRLYRPGDALAFSGLDAASPGFRDAVVAAEAAGFEPMLRLAGGRAAVFHRETLAFAWAIPAPDLRGGIRERFDVLAEVVAAALRRLGVDARIGEVPGEYCPGEHSVSAGGRRKLMGVGQRVVRGAAHVGGVIVVRGSRRVRDVLVPVYDAMGVPWDPATTGAVEDEIGPVACETVADAVLEALAERFDLVPAPPERLARARVRAAALEARFRIAGNWTDRSGRIDPGSARVG